MLWSCTPKRVQTITAPPTPEPPSPPKQEPISPLGCASITFQVMIVKEQKTAFVLYKDL